MGRPVTYSNKVTLHVPGDVKVEAAIYGLRHGLTLSALVERLLREHLAAQVKP